MRTRIPDHVRGRIYVVLTWVGPLLATYGLMGEQEAALWVGLAGAVLGNALAAVNTPTHRPAAPPRFPAEFAARGGHEGAEPAGTLPVVSGGLPPGQLPRPASAQVADGLDRAAATGRAASEFVEHHGRRLRVSITPVPPDQGGER